MLKFILWILKVLIWAVVFQWAMFFSSVLAEFHNKYPWLLSQWLLTIVQFVLCGAAPEFTPSDPAKVWVTAVWFLFQVYIPHTAPTFASHLFDLCVSQYANDMHKDRNCYRKCAICFSHMNHFFVWTICAVKFRFWCKCVLGMVCVTVMRRWVGG